MEEVEGDEDEMARTEENPSSSLLGGSLPAAARRRWRPKRRGRHISEGDERLLLLLRLAVEAPGQQRCI